jgi:hypothetical protein
MADISADVDGDGKITPSEVNICRMCLAAAILIAFGDQAIQFL